MVPIEPVFDTRPYRLLCLFCRLGADDEAPVPHRARVKELHRAVTENPGLLLRLCCNVDFVYSFQNPGRGDDAPGGAACNDLRDLTVLRLLGLTPGSIRPAMDLLDRVQERISSCDNICRYDEDSSPDWPTCPVAVTGAYERGRALGPCWHRSAMPDAECRAKTKQLSCEQIATADRLRIRPHHLLCMTCFHGGRNDTDLAPIDEDNLYECIRAIQRNPEIPVELIRGPCMICPPCSNYHPESNRCLGGQGMALRDEKKDLDTLRHLGMSYGDAVPAQELLRRLYAAIASTTKICGNGDGVETSPEWRVCGGSDGNAGYVSGRAAGLGIPGFWSSEGGFSDDEQCA